MGVVIILTTTSADFKLIDEYRWSVPTVGKAVTAAAASESVRFSLIARQAFELCICSRSVFYLLTVVPRSSLVLQEKHAYPRCRRRFDASRPPAQPRPLLLLSLWSRVAISSHFIFYLLFKRSALASNLWVLRHVYLNTSQQLNRAKLKGKIKANEKYEQKQVTRGARIADVAAIR